MMHLFCKKVRYIVALLLFSWPFMAMADIETPLEVETIPVDTLVRDSLLGLQLEAAQPKMSGFKGWWQSLINGHIDRTFEKKVDMSWIVIPTYADDGGFGIGGTASGLFRINRQDSILPPSNVSLSVNATLKAFYSVYLKSSLYLDRKNFLELYADLQSRNRYFWGINYHQCDSNYNKEQQYRYYSSNVYVKYLHQLPKHFLVGGILQFNMRDVQKWERLRSTEESGAYLNGQDEHIGYLALGAVAKYDSRDCTTNPHKGIHVMLQQMFHGRLKGNGPTCAWNTIFNFNFYVPLWKGSVLAYDFYANCFDRSVPWVIRQEISADYARMRGYYIGRYFDNNQMNTTLELRQRIYKRFGMTVWYGCGNFFSDWNDYEWKRWIKLNSFGVGFRMEFKKNINLRLDLGFGNDGPTINSAFIFDMGEAF